MTLAVASWTRREPSTYVSFMLAEIFLSQRALIFGDLYGVEEKRSRQGRRVKRRKEGKREKKEEEEKRKKKEEEKEK